MRQPFSVFFERAVSRCRVLFSRCCLAVAASSPSAGGRMQSLHSVHETFMVLRSRCTERDHRGQPAWPCSRRRGYLRACTHGSAERTWMVVVTTCSSSVPDGAEVAEATEAAEIAEVTEAQKFARTRKTPQKRLVCVTIRFTGLRRRMPRPRRHPSFAAIASRRPRRHRTRSPARRWRDRRVSERAKARRPPRCPGVVRGT